MRQASEWFHAFSYTNQKNKNMKFINTIITLSFLLAGIICTSCNNDDDDINGGEIDDTPLTEIEKEIVGGWPELGNEGITFFRDGILFCNGELGHWQYDEATEILATDIVNNKKQALIWQITMLQDGSMAGIQMWDGKTFAAQRNIDQALKDILYSHSWTRDKNGKLLVLKFNILRKDIRYSYEEHSNRQYWVGYNDITVSEQDFTSITLSSKEYGEHIIHNPYNYDMVWFEFPGELYYYPVTDHMDYLENVEMSKKESMLVGKWICQEQKWGNQTSGHLYFDDEYGMEFSDDYWGKMWSGKDQLMEAMGGKEFSWWIRGEKLYRDNDSYNILKLTDKEMELEWRDAGNIITCKFYKYNEDEGLLIDQLEYVDLGLSIKWATRNLGAEDKNTSQLGDYYAWGETSSKKEYTQDNYKYSKKDERFDYMYYLTKYSSDPHNGYNGFVDYKTILDSEDDAAIAVRGKEWRMPTLEEFQELVDNCTWTWTNDAHGNVGYKVTGQTGYYIFLPAAGYKSEDITSNSDCGFYLTNSTGDIGAGADIPIITLVFFHKNLNPKTSKNYLSIHQRACGYSIRPVHE